MSRDVRRQDAPRLSPSDAAPDTPFTRARLTRRSVLQAGLAAGTAAVFPGLGQTQTRQSCDPETLPPLPCPRPEVRLDIEDLRRYLQIAVGVELATIPFYLYTLYSIRYPTAAAYKLIRSVVVEEMLHLQLACNVLNAVGGTPRLTGEAAPTYDIRCLPHLTPPPEYPRLAPLSHEQVSQFIAVESTSELKQPFGPSCSDPSVDSICDLYQIIQTGLTQLDRTAFTGSPNRQVVAYGRDDFAVTSPETASRAFYTIVSQGEGHAAKGGNSIWLPDCDGLKSHLARFIQVDKLVDSTEACAVTPFDDTNDSPEGQLAEFFDMVYSLLLRELESGFNGAPARVAQTIGELMFPVIQVLAVYMMQERKPPVGPRFHYQTTTLNAVSQQWTNLAESDRKKLHVVARALGIGND